MFGLWWQFQSEQTITTFIAFENLFTRFVCHKLKLPQIARIKNLLLFFSWNISLRGLQQKSKHLAASSQTSEILFCW